MSSRYWEKDNSDAQYASFRDNIPYLLVLLIAHPLLRRVYESYLRHSNTNNDRHQNAPATPTAAGDTRMTQRIRFDYYFALFFITVLHGVSAVKVLAVLYVNYKIAKSLPRTYIPAATWIFNICTLFANEIFAGYPLERVAALFVGSAGLPGESEPVLVVWGRFLDSLGGLMPRWEILFNITVLRLISFSMDYYWSLDYPSTSPIEVSAFFNQSEMCPLLTYIRRSNSIRQHFRSETVSIFPQNRLPSIRATMSHIPFTRHCI